ncbi:MAG: RsmB/NOP family class I SAM-dependent RNA methyltransferase [Eubacteriales bacterium]|nr:RsmB/NOP family class I SAM-dependent RNA methyltransferase [Eubacteriales bacterium]
MTKLPEVFLDNMKTLLGEEYEAFLESYQEPRRFGLRVNTAKISAEDFQKTAPFTLTQIPWVENGFYYEEEDQPSRHAFYYAGLYYLQEPSAMTPASVLPVEPGEKVLDLCAAPGGKATELGAKLKGQGLLVANDISASRAKALQKNIEVFGIPNSFLVNETPGKLAEQFEGFFDKILVDAPCSGEGMFRKDADVAKAWTPEKPLNCAKIQKEIVVQAARMLRPGGMLLYSTCTFSPVENEQVIRYLLEMCPEFHLCPITPTGGLEKGRKDFFAPGRPEWAMGEDGSIIQELELCARIWPHKLPGEGHFLALLKKEGADGQSGAQAQQEMPEYTRPETQHEGRAEAGQPETPEYTRPETQHEGRAEAGQPETPERTGPDAQHESRAQRGCPDSRKTNCGIPGQSPSADGPGATRFRGSESREESPVQKRFRSPETRPGSPVAKRPRIAPTDQAILDDFFRDVRMPLDPTRLDLRKGQLYYLPEHLDGITGLTFLRNGLYLGELKKDRFEPSQSFAMALKKTDYTSVLNFSWTDERVFRYLKGETITVDDLPVFRPRGWQLVCVNGYPLGWGKLTGGLLKNKYLSGWRMKA